MSSHFVCILKFDMILLPSMEKEKIEHYKNLLLAEKAQLEKELADVGRINPNNPDDWEAIPESTEKEADPNDRADEMESLEDNTAIVNELEVRWAHVKKALAKIEDGSYGKCETDGELIPEDRLDANPAALTCIEHAQ